MLEKINKVNALLQLQGRSVVQQRQIGNQPVMYGFKPQYVIDAVNEVFGPENWHYQLHDTELFTSGEDSCSGQVVASVEVFMRANAESEFITHGVQYGQSQIVHGNVGDAKKGSITDAIGKGFSLFSIGKSAYRGELGPVYNGNTVELSTVPHNQKSDIPPPSPPDQKTESGLPDLPNVHYETTGDGVILAVGDTYNNRSLLKSMGFVWLPKEKAWGLLQAA